MSKRKERCESCSALFNLVLRYLEVSEVTYASEKPGREARDFFAARQQLKDFCSEWQVRGEEHG